ncbi:UNVERIFIED_CONTAM: hypothetical protein DES50_102355 [Williamsia faeni]
MGARRRWAAILMGVVMAIGTAACTLTVDGDPAPAPHTGRTWGSQAHTPEFPTAENPPG